MVLIVVVIGPLVGLRLGPGSLCTLLIRMVSASATSRSYEQVCGVEVRRVLS
jgi:hypothetical protein